MPIREPYMLWDKPQNISNSSDKAYHLDKNAHNSAVKKAPCVFILEPQKNVAKTDNILENKAKNIIQPIKTKQGEINDINRTRDDEYKVIKFNRLYPSGNYVILDKTKAKATIFKQNGDTIKSYEVGTGAEIGDELNNGYGKNGTSKQTTPAGEYNIKFRGGGGYGKFIFNLGSEYSAPSSKFAIALHIIPNWCKEERLAKLGNGSLEDNRMSAGCVNFKVEDFNELAQEVKVGTKVYILPEEKDNHFVLGKQKNGKLRFVQDKYHPRTK